MSHNEKIEANARCCSGIVLGIAGSARKQGNSSSMLARVLDMLQDSFQTELVFLAELNIQPCDGCHYCEINGRYRINDDMSELFQKMPLQKNLWVKTGSGSFARL